MMQDRLSGVTEHDIRFLRRALEIAAAAESKGNIPIGAILVLDGEILAEGENAVLIPHYHPGRHAEIEAIQKLPPGLWPKAREMTLYTTLEPCIMCMGTVLLCGIGRVVFGAGDPVGGGGHVLPHLPGYYDGGARVPSWIGPVLPGECDPLFERALSMFNKLPCSNVPFATEKLPSGSVRSVQKVG